MFYECKNIKYINFKIFNTSNVENMSGMFYYCWNLKEINLFSFNTSNVKNMSYMFNNCSNLKLVKIKKENENKFKNMIDNNTELYINNEKEKFTKKYKLLNHH